MHNKIKQVRQEIVQAFSGLAPPAPANLIGPLQGYLSRFYDQAKTVESADEFRDDLAGKHWSDLDREYLFTQKHWAAFAEVPYPGDEAICVQPDYESAEYALEFRGLNWQTLHPEFLMQQSSALSFFTLAALRYFLPAYLIADVMAWHGDTPVLELTLAFQHEPAEGAEVETLLAKYRAAGLTEAESHKMAKHFGTERFAPFNQEERKAIIAYLRYKASTGESDEYHEEQIEKALHQYWLTTIT